VDTWGGSSLCSDQTRGRDISIVRFTRGAASLEPSGRPRFGGDCPAMCRRLTFPNPGFNRGRESLEPGGRPIFEGCWRAGGLAKGRKVARDRGTWLSFSRRAPSGFDIHMLSVECARGSRGGVGASFAAVSRKFKLSSLRFTVGPFSNSSAHRPSFAGTHKHFPIHPFRRGADARPCSSTLVPRSRCFPTFSGTPSFANVVPRPPIPTNWTPKRKEQPSGGAQHVVEKAFLITVHVLFAITLYSTCIPIALKWESRLLACELEVAEGRARADPRPGCQWLGWAGGRRLARRPGGRGAPSGGPLRGGR
jgi:hypothetical protein